MFTYFTNFYKWPSREVLLKSGAEKIHKIYHNASALESFFSPMKLGSATAVLMTNVQKIFRMAFSQKKALGAAFIVLT